MGTARKGAEVGNACDGTKDGDRIVIAGSQLQEENSRGLKPVAGAHWLDTWIGIGTSNRLF